MFFRKSKTDHQQPASSPVQPDGLVQSNEAPSRSHPPLSAPGPNQSAAAVATSPYGHGSVATGHSDHLSEVKQTSPTSTTITTPGRLGFQSILNPSTDTSPDSINTASRGSIPPPNVSPRSRKRPEPASPTRAYALPAIHPRRVLTPKSPTLRAVSAGANLLPSIATGDITAGPGASETRYYTAEPGVGGVPALPPLSIGSFTAPHPFPFQPQDPSPQRRPDPATTRPLNSYRRDPDRQPGKVAQSARYPPGPPVASSNRLYQGQDLASARYEALSRSHGEGLSGGSSSYQMTLETDEGPMVVPVELDTLQASKAADEKRKRNAGASARFRARRKEKEKEASHTISQLKREMDEIRAQRDFYRQERDFVVEFMVRHPGVPLPPRPASPIVHQYADVQPELSEGSRPRSDSAPSPQRRRFDDDRPMTYSPPRVTEHTQGAGFATSFQGERPSGLPPPTQLPSLFTTSNAPRASINLPDLPLPGTRAHSSYDPFRRDPFERTWDHGR
jgi:hypothetical protein